MNTFDFCLRIIELKKNRISVFIQVELSEAQNLSQYIPEISFVMETSAKENTNIKDIFYLLATELMVSIVNRQKLSWKFEFLSF